MRYLLLLLLVLFLSHKRAVSKEGEIKLVKGAIVSFEPFCRNLYFFPGDYLSVDSFLYNAKVGYQLNNWRAGELLDTIFEKERIWLVGDSARNMLSFLPVKMDFDVAKIDSNLYGKSEIFVADFSVVYNNVIFHIGAWVNIDFNYSYIECRRANEIRQLGLLLKGMSQQQQQEMWLKGDE